MVVRQCRHTEGLLAGQVYSPSYKGRDLLLLGRFTNSARQERFTHSAREERFTYSAMEERLTHSAREERFTHSAMEERFTHSAREEGFTHLARLGEIYLLSNGRRGFSHS